MPFTKANKTVIDLTSLTGTTPDSLARGDHSHPVTPLPTASASTLGGVKVGTGLVIDVSGVLSATGGGSYSLPTASVSTLGGVKVGSGLAIDGAGVLSSTGGGSYTLPTASVSTLGGIMVGSGLAITGGVLSVTGGGSSYTLPIASGSVLGGVKVGSGLAIDGTGILSSTVTAYTLPTASASVLGGVKVGTGLAIAAGVLSTTGGGVSTDQGYNNVGSYCFCGTSSPVGPGGTIAGSSLMPGGIEGLGVNVSAFHVAGSLSGTWRCCGYSNITSPDFSVCLTLFQRIA